MTGRERLVAAARGGETDRKPVIAWPGPVDVSDAVVVAPSEVGETVAAHPERAVLAEVCNPYRIASERFPGLMEILASDPAKGDALLSQAADQVRADIDFAMTAGADGVVYRLHGATPAQCTPMEYGGYYLDRDRELLTAIEEANFNFIFVTGGPGTYLDFVSDLPAHAFGWDIKKSAIPVSEVRAMRTGALAVDSDESDIQLSSMVDDVTAYLEAKTVAAA